VKLDRLLAALASFRGDGAAVRDWSLLATESRGLTFGVKDRELGNPHAPLALEESGDVRYRLVWSDGRVSRGNLERRQIEGDLSETLGYARAAAYDDPDAAWVLGSRPMPEVAMLDDDAAALARGDTGLLADRLERVRSRIEREAIRTWSGSFSAHDSTARVLTSAGLDAQARGTVVGWHVVVNGEIGDGFSARRAEAEAAFEARLERLLELARRLERPGPTIPAGARPVLLAPRVVEAYVLGTLLENLSGPTVAHGEGHFRREQFGSGHPVLREDLELRLDPLQPLRRGTYRFTAEGVPAAPCVFIERGRLVQPLLDLKYARRLGLDPTPLPLGLDTLHFAGSPPLALPDALAAADDGVLVLSVLGVHTQDDGSGDFSLAAPQALGIRGGALAGRLRGTLSGNLFRLLSDGGLRFVAFEDEPTPGLLLRCRFDPQDSRA